MKRLNIAVLFTVLLMPALAAAHFMVVQPSMSVVIDQDEMRVIVDVRFAHPFEQDVMDMALPVQFGVLAHGKKIDLKGELKEIKAGNNRTYTAAYRIIRPGDHIFFVKPQPYWEPSEEKFLVHYTKTVVNAFGLEEGWDKLVGFKTEIRPLTRPYGLWTGNAFQGQVLLNGGPVPGAKVEVTYDNSGNKVKAPAQVYHIQVVSADQNGVFTYVMPRAGWRGFAALNEDEKKLKSPEGKLVPVEIGAVIWIKAEDMR